MMSHRIILFVFEAVSWEQQLEILHVRHATCRIMPKRRVTCFHIVA